MIIFVKDEDDVLVIPVGLGPNIANDPNLTPGNIKAGVTIYGVTGTYEG